MMYNLILCNQCYSNSLKIPDVFRNYDFMNGVHVRGNLQENYDEVLENKRDLDTKIKTKNEPVAITRWTNTVLQHPGTN